MTVRYALFSLYSKYICFNSFIIHYIIVGESLVLLFTTSTHEFLTVAPLPTVLGIFVWIMEGYIKWKKCNANKSVGPISVVLNLAGLLPGITALVLGLPPSTLVSVKYYCLWFTAPCLPLRNLGWQVVGNAKWTITSPQASNAPLLVYINSWFWEFRRCRVTCVS